MNSNDARGTMADEDNDVLTNLYPALAQCVFVIFVGYSAGRIKIIPPGGIKGETYLERSAKQRVMRKV